MILATPNQFDTLKPVLAHLRHQSIATDIELVLVAPARAPFDADPLWMDGFHSWQLVRIPAMPSTAVGNAAGVRHARAKLVALAADHYFPEQRWAEALVSAHQGGHAAVGPVIRNANPETTVSWADFLMRSGNALHGRTGGVVDSLPAQNCCYRRNVLLELGDDLDALLAEEPLLLNALRAQGHTLHLEPHAVTARVNYAVFDSWIAATFFGGRVSAGRRTADWNALRRLMYCLAALFLPYVRLTRTLKWMHQAGHAPLSMLRAAPYLWLGLTVESMGEFLAMPLGWARRRKPRAL